MTTQERARLQNCEIPRSEEERGATPTALKWGTLGDLEFAYHGEKKAKLEVDTARVSPLSAEPQPKPQSTLSSDKVAGKERGKGKARIPHGKIIP